MAGRAWVNEDIEEGHSRQMGEIGKFLRTIGITCRGMNSIMRHALKAMGLQNEGHLLSIFG